MTRTRKKKSFVVCLSNDGYGGSLEPRKIYVALRDAAAERNGLVRVVESRVKTTSTRVSDSRR